MMLMNSFWYSDKLESGCVEIKRHEKLYALINAQKETRLANSAMVTAVDSL
ncbi:hypothetical protein PPBDW_I20727 [Photobacterium kishitanii]|nr:hypothetical protein PPBDW_I20727 [Photobacterium kishitanii]